VSDFFQFHKKKPEAKFNLDRLLLVKLAGLHALCTLTMRKCSCNLGTLAKVTWDMLSAWVRLGYMAYAHCLVYMGYASWRRTVYYFVGRLNYVSCRTCRGASIMHTSLLHPGLFMVPTNSSIHLLGCL